MKDTETLDPIHILLVEDSPIAAAKIQNFLSDVRQPEFVLEHTLNFQDAASRVEDGGIDVILLDLGLPDSKGLDTLSRMREHVPELAIVVLTGITDEETALEALRQGAQDYLVKGQVDGKLLVRAIRYAIERKLADESLRKSEASHRLLLDAMPDVVYKINPEGYFTFINPAIARLGYDAESLIGEHFSTILHPDDVEKVSRTIVLPRYAGTATGEQNAPKLFDERRTGIRMTTNLVLRLIPKNWRETDETDFVIGSLTSYGEVSATGQYQTDLQTREKQFAGTVGIIKDITKRKRAEAEKEALEHQLHQAQKMEAIGRLAGGVAHDMNNVLGAILGSASVLEFDIPMDSSKRGDIDNILVACRKARDLTRDLLGFARKGKYVKEIISLNDVAMEVKTLLTRTIPKKIEIVMDLDDQLENIEGDLSQIHHAMMNICINGVDSMQSQGTLTIETRNVPKDDSRNSVFPNLEPGNYVEVAVHDTGIGMDQETQEKVFEPFFTTKPKGEGTGLGLSMVYGVVKNHGGIVSTVSEPGKGTMVAFCLPATKQDQPPSKPSPTLKPSYSPKSETILVVDDEEIIRQSSRRLLEKLGYRVLTAENGKIAARIYKEKEDIVSLVLLDMVMPIMDGVETFVSLHRMNPDAKILLFSGYSNDENVDMMLGN